MVVSLIFLLTLTTEIASLYLSRRFVDERRVERLQLEMARC